MRKSDGAGPVPSTTTVCIAGGGPAGLVLGLLLARGGIRVTVLEKHADFLRDFRGDTVHASTLTLLDELGLGGRFGRLPARWVTQGQVDLGEGPVPLAEFSHLPGAHQHIALVPQWDLLEMLADEAAREPSFTLLRDAEVTGLVVESGRVRGVRWRDRRGDGAAPGNNADHELRADLVVACDGRDSAVRRAAGLRPRAYGVPIDVEWFRLPRHDGDPSGLVFRPTAGRFMVLIDRGDAWQCAYVVAKGSDASLRAEPISELAASIAALVPWLADRVAVLDSWDDVKLLSVSVDRLRRWWRPGLLLIGDAAHAMSPVGGVGINLAVQDAVAAARIVGGALRERGGRGPVDDVLRRIQRRRLLPTAVVQTGQRVAHRLIHEPLTGTSRQPGALRVMRLVTSVPALRQHGPARLAARVIAIGVVPEHAPAWAARSTVSTVSAVSAVSESEPAVR